MFSHAWHQLHVSPRWTLVTCFSALATGNIFSLSFALATCFSALDTGYMFYRACHWLHVSRFWRRFRVFPRLPLTTCFPMLGVGNMSLRIWRCLHVLPRLSLVTCFSALATGYMFSRACNWRHYLIRLVLATYFLAFATGYMFFFPRVPLV